MDHIKEMSDYMLGDYKSNCLALIITKKLREKFKERYRIESGQDYKCNPLHGEFVISIMKQEFRNLSTYDQAGVKTGNVDRFSDEVLFSFLLSFIPKKMNPDKLFKENEIISKVQQICYNSSEIVSQTESKNKRNGLIECLRQLCIINGEVFPIEEIKFKLDTIQDQNKAMAGIPGYIINEKMEKECLRIKDLGNKFFAEKEFSKASETYCQAIELCVGNQNDISFKTKGILYLNKSIAKYELYKQRSRISINQYVSTEIEREIDDCIVDCKLAATYIPSYGKIYMKLGQLSAHQGTSDHYLEAIVYGTIALRLDKTNLEYQNVVARFINAFKYMRQKDCLLKVGKIIDYQKIAKDHIKKNKFINPISANEKLDLNQEDSNFIKNLVKSTTLPKEYIISLTYYKAGSKLLKKKEYIKAFKYLAKSISMGENSYSGGMYKLAIMYEDCLGDLKENNASSLSLSLLFQASIKNHKVEFQMKPGYFENDLKYEIDYLKTEYPVLKARLVLGRLFFSGFNTDRDVHQSIYWLNLVANLGLDAENCSGDASYSLGSIYYYGPPNFRNKNEALRLWKRGYEELGHSGCLDCYTTVLKIDNPVEASKLMLTALNNHKCGRGCMKHGLGRQLYLTEQHDYQIPFDYNKLLKFKKEGSIMASRLIECMDLTNQFLKSFSQAKTSDEKEKSFKFLSDAYLIKELYAVQIPADQIDSIKSYLSNQISRNNKASKSIRIAWIGFNTYSLYTIDQKDVDILLINNSEKLLKYIDQSIKLYPKEIEIFKFFSSLYNKYVGQLESSLDDLNICISSINPISSKNIDIYYYFKADVLGKLIRYDEAITTFKQYLEKSPSDGKWRMNGYYSIAAFDYFLNKNRANADKNFQIATQSEETSLYCFLPYKGEYYQKFEDPSLNPDSFFQHRLSFNVK